MARFRVTLTLDAPPGATKDDVSDYVEDAVGTWQGQLRPPGAYGDDDDGHPMWGLQHETVVVTDVARINKKRAAPADG